MGAPTCHGKIREASPASLIPLHDPHDALRPTAIALGTFDGLHQGHRRVIAAITADPGDAVPTVVSFWPHPREVLHGESRLRLDLPEEKLELLEPLGVAQLVLVPFNRDLAALSPEAFVEQVLVRQLGARSVAVGENFRFGAGRRGDGGDLQRIAAGHGVTVSVLPTLHDGGVRVSSSRIRQALAAGEIDEALRLLQRPYRFSGTVVAGRGLGKGLGWPTANLRVDARKFMPQQGVYAAWAWCSLPGAAAPARSGQALAAVMNLGPQPTVDPTAPSAVEVHLLDRSLDLAGAQLTVEPVRLLRGQQRFDSLQDLSAAIGADAEQARALLATRGPAEIQPLG